MSKAITYWWAKYQILRTIKADYFKEIKTSPHPMVTNEEYLVRLLEAIK